MNLDR